MMNIWIQQKVLPGMKGTENESAPVEEVTYIEDLISLAPIDLADSDCEIVDCYENIQPMKEKQSIVSNTATTEKTSYGKGSFFLPVKFFDNARNIANLGKCKPMSVNIVDCGKFPWYYKKFYAASKPRPKSKQVYTLNHLIEDMTYQNRKKKITLPSNVKENVISEPSLTNSSKEIVGKLTLIPSKLPEVDFKKNKGLVGLKITKLNESGTTETKRKKTNFEQNVLKKKSKLQTDLKVACDKNKANDGNEIAEKIPELKAEPNNPVAEELRKIVCNKESIKCSFKLNPILKPLIKEKLVKVSKESTQIISSSQTYSKSLIQLDVVTPNIKIVNKNKDELQVHGALTKDNNEKVQNNTSKMKIDSNSHNKKSSKNALAKELEPKKNKIVNKRKTASEKSVQDKVKKLNSSNLNISTNKNSLIKEKVQNIKNCNFSKKNTIQLPDRGENTDPNIDLIPISKQKRIEKNTDAAQTVHNDNNNKVQTNNINPSAVDPNIPHETAKQCFKNKANALELSNPTESSSDSTPQTAVNAKPERVNESASSVNAIATNLIAESEKGSDFSIFEPLVEIKTGPIEEVNNVHTNTTTQRNNTVVSESAERTVRTAATQCVQNDIPAVPKPNQPQEIPQMTVATKSPRGRYRIHNSVDPKVCVGVHSTQDANNNNNVVNNQGYSGHNVIFPVQKVQATTRWPINETYGRTQPENISIRADNMTKKTGELKVQTVSQINNSVMNINRDISPAPANKEAMEAVLNAELRKYRKYPQRVQKTNEVLVRCPSKVPPSETSHPVISSENKTIMLSGVKLQHSNSTIDKSKLKRKYTPTHANQGLVSPYPNGGYRQPFNNNLRPQMAPNPCVINDWRVNLNNQEMSNSYLAQALNKPPITRPAMPAYWVRQPPPPAPYGHGTPSHQLQKTHPPLPHQACQTHQHRHYLPLLPPPLPTPAVPSPNIYHQNQSHPSCPPMYRWGPPLHNMDRHSYTPMNNAPTHVHGPPQTMTCSPNVQNMKPVNASDNQVARLDNVAQIPVNPVIDKPLATPQPQPDERAVEVLYPNTTFSEDPVPPVLEQSIYPNSALVNSIRPNLVPVQYNKALNNAEPLRDNTKTPTKTTDTKDASPNRIKPGDTLKISMHEVVRPQNKVLGSKKNVEESPKTVFKSNNDLFPKNTLMKPIDKAANDKLESEKPKGIGYSPPILPIPTVKKSHEILALMEAMKTPCFEKYTLPNDEALSLTTKEHSSTQKPPELLLKEATIPPSCLKKTTPQKRAGNQVAVRALKMRRISIDEYKKRNSKKVRFADDVDVVGDGNPVAEFPQENHQRVGENRNRLDMVDLGYDSDTHAS